jgi:hypothetical protein
MKACPNCNYKNNDLDSICSACGTQLPLQQMDNQFNNNQGYNNQGYGNQGYNNINNQQKSPAGPLSIASLVTGIVGLVLACCCAPIGLISAIAAIVTGIIGLKKNNFSNDYEKVFCIVGIVLGAIALILNIAMGIYGVSQFLSTSQYKDMMNEL